MSRSWGSSRLAGCCAQIHLPSIVELRNGDFRFSMIWRRTSRNNRFSSQKLCRTSVWASIRNRLQGRTVGGGPCPVREAIAVDTRGGGYKRQRQDIRFHTCDVSGGCGLIRHLRVQETIDNRLWCFPRWDARPEDTTSSRRGLYGIQERSHPLPMVPLVRLLGIRRSVNASRLST